MKCIKKTIIAVLLVFFAIPNTGLAAAVFNRNMIISDNDLISSNTMSVAQIQKFLDSKGGVGRYQTTDPQGRTKSAAQIIHDAGVYYRINPQYLMVRMQIEQSLITMSSPTQARLDWATGYGVCDSCSKNDPVVRQYIGFFNQVNWAAKRVRESYLADLDARGYTISGWGPGITKTTGDGYSVTPVNDATAALYTYTPYVYNANYNIWKYWNAWFTKQYPDGSLLQVQGEHGVYLIQNGKKRPFTSRTALVSRFDPTHIILVSLSDIVLYADGRPIKFANYSLIRSDKTGRVFLIDGDQRRYITSPEVFREIGFNPEEVIVAPESDLASYTYGPNIDMRSIYPTGTLLQLKETGGIYYVKNGIKYPIWSKEIYKSQFGARKPVVVDETSLAQFPTGKPIGFKDGELVTSPNANGVYVISNGMRRGISSIQIFNTLGYQWKNVIRTTDASLFIHPLGTPIK